MQEQQPQSPTSPTTTNDDNEQQQQDTNNNTNNTKVLSIEQTITQSGEIPHISKRQIKKQKNREKRRELFKLKKAAKKLEKKRKHCESLQSSENGEKFGENDENFSDEKKREQKMNRRQYKQQKQSCLRQVYEQQGTESSVSVIIDCSFNDKMTPRELVSMSQQLMICYSINASLADQHIASSSSFLSLNEEEENREENGGICGENEKQFQKKVEVQPLTDKEKKLPFYLSFTSLQSALFTGMHKFGGFPHHWIIDQTSKHFTEHFSREFANKKLVYLSADADEEVTELEVGTMYILGGLVDRNRHKNLCHHRALELNIPQRRLPIGQYLNLKLAPVLTVNQCLEIMAQVYLGSSWRDAVEKVVPQRKRLVTVSSSSSGDASTGDDDESGEDEEMIKANDGEEEVVSLSSSIVESKDGVNDDSIVD